jgi:ribonuclease T1
MATFSARNRLLTRLLLLAALCGIAWFVCQRRESSVQLPAAVTNTRSQQQSQQTQDGIPAYAHEVLHYIRQNGHAPDGYVGGREFQNREKKLPVKKVDGLRIRYSEWDVRPKVTGQSRGPERLVTSSDHHAWYTKDHYNTFLTID